MKNKTNALLIIGIIVVILFSFTKCSVSKQKTTSKVDSSMSITSQGYRKIEKDSTVETSTKVTEQIDTTITIKSDTLKDVKSISDILRGDTLKSSDNGLIIKIFKDATGLLQVVGIVKEKKVIVKSQKVTESSTKTIDKGKSITKENITTKVKVKKQQKNVAVVTKTSYWSWWYLLLLLIPIGYYLYRKFKIF